MQPKRLATAVYDAIKPRILEGVYQPGDWLSVDDLCKEFQVSRQPVMESLRRLAGEWLVTIIPQVGCRVTTYDPRSFQDYISIFGDAESQVGALAAERRTEEQLQDLTEILDELASHVTSNTEYNKVLSEFHHLILEMAHSEILARICDQLWDLGTFVYGAVSQDMTGEKIVEHSLEAQRQLVEAIRDQNPALARLQMQVWLTAFHGAST